MDHFMIAEELERHHDTGLFNDEEYALLYEKKQAAEDIAKIDWHIVLSEDGRFSWEELHEDNDSLENIDSKSVDEIVGRNLLRWRKFHNMSQTQVADAIFCSQQAYQKYEKGMRSINIAHLVKLSKLFNTSIDALATEPSGIRDIPSYQPFAKLPKTLTVMNAEAVEKGRAIVKGCIDVANYERLYSLLDGRNRSYKAVGFAQTIGGGQALLVRQDGAVRGEDKLGNDDNCIEKEDKQNFTPNDLEEISQYHKALQQDIEDLICHQEMLFDEAEPTEKLDPDCNKEQFVLFSADPKQVAYDNYVDTVSTLLGAALKRYFGKKEDGDDC